MLNFTGQTSRATLYFGRLHHVVTSSSSSGAFSGFVNVTPASALPISSLQRPLSSQQMSEARHLHRYQGPLASSAASSFMKSVCRVPCMSVENCGSQTCHKLFATSSSVNALTKSSAVLPEDKPGIMTRMLDTVGITGKLRFNRFRMRVAGLNMYKACADGYDFETFFRACNMPDTLFSWFLVMELHVWMCMVRLKQEGREGKYMTHYLILSMWHDIQERGKLMRIPSVKMKESLSKMVEQFNGALFAYDEGLLSNDKVLAAALWRNLFLRNCEDPERLANMVEYVRQQVQYLDSLDTNKLLQVGRIKWLPYKGGVPDSDAPLPKAASPEDELDIPEVDKVPIG